MTIIISDNVKDEKSHEIILKYLSFRTLMSLAGGLTVNFITIFYLEILNTADYGLLLAISFILITILEYPTGILTDLIGEKNILVLSYLLYSISWLGFYFAKKPIDILIAEIISCIGVALNSGTLATWLVSSYQKIDPKLHHYKKIIGRVNSVYLVISSFIGLIGGLLADKFVIRSVFLIECFLSILCIFVFAIFMNLRYDKQMIMQKKENRYLKEIFSGINDFFSNRRLQKITISYVLIQTSYTLFFNFFWQPLSYSASGNYFALSLTGGFGIIVMAGTNWISTTHFNFGNNLWRQSLLFILPFLMIWIISSMNNIILYCLTLVFYQALVGIIFPHYDVNFHKMLNTDNRARMIAIKNVIRTIMMSLGFGITGILQYNLGFHYSIIFSVLLLFLGSYIIKESYPNKKEKYDPLVNNRKKKEKGNLKHDIISSGASK